MFSLIIVRVFHVKLSDEKSLNQEDIDDIIDHVTNDQLSNDNHVTNEDLSKSSKSIKKPPVIEIDLSKKPKSKETATLLASVVEELFVRSNFYCNIIIINRVTMVKKKIQNKEY